MDNANHLYLLQYGIAKMFNFEEEYQRQSLIIENLLSYTIAGYDSKAQGNRLIFTAVGKVM